MQTEKCVDGFSDTSRNWYFSVRDEIIKHGCSRSEELDMLFYWHHEEKLSGMFILHVDDFLWAGTEDLSSLMSECLPCIRHLQYYII